MTDFGFDNLRRCLVGIVGTVLIAGTAALASGAQAATLVGVFEGNDPFGGQEKGLYGNFGGVEISSPSLAKCDVSGLSCNWENGAVEGEDYTSAFDMSFVDDKSGGWSFTSNPTLTHAPAYKRLGLDIASEKVEGRGRVYKTGR